MIENNTSRPLITVVLGTRPEAIKLAPVIKTFKACKLIRTRVLATGQHREMVENVMDLFEIKPDKDLNIMKANQSLSDITIRTLIGVEADFENYCPSLVIVQGDTSTAFATSLAAFYKNIPIAHVEAGLRTNNLFEPFPEEANRRLISQLSKIHFAPSSQAMNNLKSAGVLGDIYITGNTVIDSLLMISDISKDLPLFEGIDMSSHKIILVTVHRRENLGEKLENICKALIKLTENHPDIKLILPMHLNPLVRGTLIKFLSSVSSIILTEPLEYNKLISVLKKCSIVLTDSGGLQEEAPSLSKPVLVLRDHTERVEAVEAGTAKLIGTNPENIYRETDKLLSDEKAYNLMAKALNPYGDGKASEKILEICIEFLS